MSADPYVTVDMITPKISLHKPVIVNGGIVAKSASLGNESCKFVVNNNGIYIVIPSKFDDTGNLSVINHRTYNLGAMIEAVQELNRRTAWMETDMSLADSLKYIDNIGDNTTNTGAFYNNTTDLLPGLKQTISHGNHFMLINTNDEAIRFYEITDRYKDILNCGPLLASGPDHYRHINEIIKNDNHPYTGKYISPQILNKTDNSFNILVLDIINDGNYPTLSDKYYTYTPIFDEQQEYKGYNVTLKDGVTINNICMDGGKIIPPIPYFCTIGNMEQLTVISFAGLFKERIEFGSTIDFSDWDFSGITDMSHMFDDCGSNITVKWSNEGMPPFIKTWTKSPIYVVLDEDNKLIGVKDEYKNDIDTTDINLANFIWKGKDESGNEQWFRFNPTKSVPNNTLGTITLTVF